MSIRFLCVFKYSFHYRRFYPFDCSDLKVQVYSELVFYVEPLLLIIISICFKNNLKRVAKYVIGVICCFYADRAEKEGQRPLYSDTEKKTKKRNGGSLCLKIPGIRDTIKERVFSVSRSSVRTNRSNGGITDLRKTKTYHRGIYAGLSGKTKRRTNRTRHADGRRGIGDSGSGQRKDPRSYKSYHSSRFRSRRRSVQHTCDHFHEQSRRRDERENRRHGGRQRGKNVGLYHSLHVRPYSACLRVLYRLRSRFFHLFRD